MDVIKFIKSLKILDYYLVNSACDTLPDFASGISSGEQKSSSDAALDSAVTEYFESEGHTEFTTSSVVEYLIKIESSDDDTEEQQQQNAIQMNFSFVTRFRVDGSEEECREFFENNDWLFRQRNATISHFLGGQIIEKTAFNNIRLPMN